MSSQVYLAGPIQHAADHGKGWRARLKDGEIDHEGDVEFVDPLDQYNTHEMEYKEWNSEDVIGDDLDLIAECDAILVHWLEVPTCGTPMEVFFAQWFPKMAEMIKGLAGQIPSTVPKRVLIEAAADDAGLEDWMVDVLLAINAEVPVVVQTRVPPEEISPWLSGHTDAIVEDFAGAVHWIENNVNGGNAPEPETLEPKYEIIEAEA